MKFMKVILLSCSNCGRYRFMHPNHPTGTCPKSQFHRLSYQTPVKIEAKTLTVLAAASLTESFI